jgi:3-hydroxypropanoate dehydrogenase
MMNDGSASNEVTPEREQAWSAIRDMRARIQRLDDDGLGLILSEARSHYAWTDRPVTDDDLRQLYEAFKFGPTSANGNHARFLFVRRDETKEKLAACVNPGNIEKVLTAPVTAIIAYDVEFWRHLLRLHPHKDMRPTFAADAEKAEAAAFRNGSLQGAYLMIAARALGFDIGAMSGFSNAKVDKAFLAGTTFKSNFLCNIGYADETALFQRLPRFDFDEICELI